MMRALGGKYTVDWFRSLEAVENRTNVAFDFSFVKPNEEHIPPVGRFSSYGQMYMHIVARAERNWTHYQS